MDHEVLRTDGMAWVQYDQALEKRLTLPTKYDGMVNLTKKVEDLFLLIPRALVPVSSILDARSDGHPIEVNCTTPPRSPTQKTMVTQVVEELGSGKSFIAQAATGFGKTYVAINALCQIGKTTLIVVTKEDLMTQWRNSLLSYTNLTPDDIGVIQQKKCSFEGKKVVLAMVHTLAKDKFGDAVKEYFGLVVFDEVHRMAATTFSKACGMFSAKLRLGLSATVNRPDGKGFVFKAHIGPISVVADLPLVTPKILVKNTSYQVPKWMTHLEPGRLVGLIKDMANNQERNQLIVSFVKSAYEKGRHTIVFSELIEGHLHRLHKLLIHFGIPDSDIGYYVGGMSEKAREESSKKKVILATYPMTAEATDIPWLDTAVFATPRVNIIQPMGRILRQWEGKKEPVVLDLVDVKNSMLTAFFHKRSAQYRKIKATMVSL